MNCTKCGNENREGANFCQACGQPLRLYQGPGYTSPGYYCPPYQSYPYPYPPQSPEQKDTMVALIFALLIPGAGHMYAGELKKGILILAVFLLIGILSALVWFATIWNFGVNANPFPSTVAIIFALVIAALIWLYQLYDAYQAALRFNANLGSKPPH